MKKYKGYLIDLDGTMYKGSEQIEAAGDFVKKLRDKEFPIYSLPIIHPVHQPKLLKS